MNSDAFLDDLVERIARATAQHLVELLPHPPTLQSKTPAPSAFLTTREAAKFLTLSLGTLEAWRAKGKGPRPTKCGNAVRYSRAELNKWIAENTMGRAK
jgi:excisionase family DNA binding protein